MTDSAQTPAGAAGEAMVARVMWKERPALTKPQAIALMMYEGSHAAYTRSEGDWLLAPFGLKAHCWTERANTDPKGLLNPTLKRGAKVEVCGGWTLMGQLCNHYNIERGSFLGRGFQFRDDAERLERAHPDLFTLDVDEVTGEVTPK